MKHIKSYEHTIEDDSPQIGDYVIIDSESKFPEIKNFINNSIGKIIDIDTNAMDITVQFENIPNNIIKSFSNRINSKNTRSFHFRQIKHLSPNKKELEHILRAKKYNL